jgi:hypothetical protein
MSRARSGARALTPKQERFAVLLVEGEAQSSAYRIAYAASAMTDAAVGVEAARLVRHPGVKARVESLRRNLQRVLGVSRGSLLQELNEAQEIARQQGDTKTLAAIVMSKAKLLGFLQHVPQPKSPGQREAEIPFGMLDQETDAE